ncbi:MAG: hypothetical protein LBI33_08375 [Propionibacteriaceae bacterium]|jgi:hypothetical protein|nr:hypothetical protein [Propionibacteriaceae bacterium]
MADTGLTTDWTLTSLLDELDSIEEHHEPHHRAQPLKITTKQQTIYNKLGLPTP